MPFTFEELKTGAILIKPKVFGDERGFFMETYQRKDFEENGIRGDFFQDNQSKSTYGVLRGLHFQRNPYAQAKIVRCVKGLVFDVAVDLREDSPTFGKYESVILSEYNKRQVYIPQGFAHGFLVLSDVAEVCYKVDNDYAPKYEGGVIWDDADVGIKWPVEEPVLSDKDKEWPTLKELRDRGELF